VPLRATPSSCVSVLAFWTSSRARAYSHSLTCGVIDYLPRYRRRRPRPRTIRPTFAYRPCRVHGTPVARLTERFALVTPSKRRQEKPPRFVIQPSVPHHNLDVPGAGGGDVQTRTTDVVMGTVEKIWRAAVGHRAVDGGASVEQGRLHGRARLRGGVELARLEGAVRRVALVLDLTLAVSGAYLLHRDEPAPRR
jgi:hypothetical protein